MNNWIKYLIQLLIRKGKKQRIILSLEKIFINIKKIYGCLNTFFKQIETNIFIRMFCYIKKVGGKKLLIPHILKSKDSIPYSVKLIVRSINSRTERKFQERIQNELIDVYNNKGLSIKKKNDMYRLIEANYTNIRFKRKK